MTDNSINPDKQLKSDQIFSNEDDELDNTDVRDVISKLVQDTSSLLDLVKDDIGHDGKYQAYSDTQLPATQTHSAPLDIKAEINGKDPHFSNLSPTESDLLYTGPKFLYELTEKVTKNIQTSLTNVPEVPVEEQSREKIVEKRDAAIDNEELAQTYSHMSYFDKREKGHESKIHLEMIDTFKDLQEFIPNEQDFMYNSSRNHFLPSPRDDRYDLYDNMENYIRAKSYEFFGYIDDSFPSNDEELRKDKQTETDKTMVSGTSFKTKRRRKIKRGYFFKMPVITEDMNFIPPNEVKVLDASDESEPLVNFHPANELSYIQSRKQYGGKEESNSDEETSAGQSYALSVKAAVHAKTETKVANITEDPRSILLHINVDKIDLPLTPTTLLDPAYSSAAWVHEKYQINPEYYQIKTDANMQDHSTSNNNMNMGYSYYNLQRSNSSLDSMSNFTLSKNPLSKNTCHEDGHFLWLKSLLTPNIRSIRTINLETK